MKSPKRSMSQNFIVNRDVLNEIENILPLFEGRTVAEIGPGMGALTEIISRKSPAAANLIEKDDRLAEEIKCAFPQFNTIHADIMTYDFTEDTVVGAIPYSISRDILKKIVQFNTVREAYLIVQKEFAEKITEHKVKALPLLVNTFFETRIALGISRHAFKPVPRVDSSLLVIRRKRDNVKNMGKYWEFLNLISSNKRKVLCSILPVNDRTRICSMHTEEIYSLYADINIHSH